MGLELSAGGCWPVVSCESSGNSGSTDDGIVFGNSEAVGREATRFTGTGGQRFTPISTKASAVAPGVGSPTA